MGRPGDDREFTTPGDQGEQGRIDLLTVLEHEMGHLLGLAHADQGVMVDTLAPGMRRLPGSPLSLGDSLASPTQTDQEYDHGLVIPVDDQALTVLASELIQSHAKRPRLVSNKLRPLFDSKSS
jgi:hypothetical protein